MKKSFLRKAVAFAMSVCLLSQAAVATVSAEKPADESVKSNSASAYEISPDSYEAYKLKYADKAYSGKDIVIDATKDFESSDKNVKVSQDSEGKYLFTDEESTVTWTFNVEKTAFYNIKVKYHTVKGKGLDMERSVLIDGKGLFGGLAGITFRRIWENDGEPYTDDFGNEYHTAQKEKYSARVTELYSSKDKRDEGYCLYLKEGEHTITFQSIQEPMGVCEFVLTAPYELKPYSEVKKEYDQKGYKAVSADTEPIKIQGESAVIKSSSTLYATSDRTSPQNEPYNMTKKKVNTIGGANWSQHTKWIDWTFKVEKSGLYEMAFRAKQNFNSGLWSTRAVAIDGVIPFAEAGNVKFDYDLGWQMKAVDTATGEPCLIYLEEGEHTLSVSVAEGDIQSTSAVANKILTELTALYRKILMVTGTKPDTLRDYDLFGNIANCEETFKEQLGSLKQVVANLEEMNVGKEQTSPMERLIIQIEDFLESPESIPERIETFNSNITTFASWANGADNQPLTIDYMIFQSPENELPKADCSFLKKAWHEIYNFFVSFVTDYNTMSVDTNNKDRRVITLWSGLGIDQAVILKSLIDGGFSANCDIDVDLKLVNMASLLNAVAVDRGPDVALFLGAELPVNYALRGAIYDLTKFSDCDEVLSQFYPSSYEGFQLEGGIYALPEQQSWSMMFYRKDILDEMNIKVPQTWEDIYAALAVLQTNNLNMGVDSPFGASAGLTGINGIFLMKLYQNGGSLYDKEGKKCTLNSENAIEAFTDWTELYTKYKLPQAANIFNRFRTGETPIVISAYTFYNTLQLSAPEINGLWEMALLPGTVSEDGTINRASAAGASGCSIFANADDVEASWEFLKWWVSEETQVIYGNEIESLQGASARWPTANKKALEGLPWSNKQLKLLQEQQTFVKGTPQVAGGYYTARYVDNAIRAVVNENENTRETILDYVDIINAEIETKRKEFGLSE